MRELCARLVRRTRDDGRSWRVPAVMVRGRYELRLLLGQRLVLFCLLDLSVVVYGVYQTFVTSNGSDDAYRLYVQLGILPLLVLALPVLSTVLFIERHSGSLDLALSTRSVERYLARRVAAVALLFAAQGSVAMLFAPHPSLLARCGAVVSVCAATALMASIVVFWAVRVQTSGAVCAASLATALLLSKWLFADPFPNPLRAETAGSIGRFLGLPPFAFRWAWTVFVLVATALVLYLYAQRRLRRPETLL
ncbi:MAG: hypothetical protein AAF690_22045 [Acidobacteriota bacterium]